jgi:hypothetical protein
MNKRVILWFLAGWLLAMLVSPRQVLGYVGVGKS